MCSFLAPLPSIRSKVGGESNSQALQAVLVPLERQRRATKGDRKGGCSTTLEMQLSRMMLDRAQAANSSVAGGGAALQGQHPLLHQQQQRRHASRPAACAAAPLHQQLQQQPEQQQQQPQASTTEASFQLPAARGRGGRGSSRSAQSLYSVAAAPCCSQPAGPAPSPPNPILELASSNPAALGAVAAASGLSLYGLARLFNQGSRTYDGNVGQEYDSWTEEGLLEYYWGEHIHLGHYSAEERAAGYRRKDFKQAKFDFVDEMLRFAGAPAPPTSILDVGCGFGGSSRHLAKKFPGAKVKGGCFCGAFCAARQYGACPGLQARAACNAGGRSPRATVGGYPDGVRACVATRMPPCKRTGGPVSMPALLFATSCHACMQHCSVLAQAPPSHEVVLHLTPPPHRHHAVAEAGGAGHGAGCSAGRERHY